MAKRTKRSPLKDSIALNVISEHRKNRARILYAHGLTLKQVAERAGIHYTTLSKYNQDGKWYNDKLPPFTFDDLVSDMETMLFLLQQDGFIKILDKKEIDTSRLTLDLKNMVNAIKELTALAPMRSAKIAIENTTRLMELAGRLENKDLATAILTFLQGDYEKQRAIMAGLPAQD